MDEIKTKKSLGQHWLYDTDVLSDMVELAEVSAGDIVIEVGPGLGTLTKQLLEADAEVTAVEYDYDLYKKLEKDKTKLFGVNGKNLILVNQDILTFNFNDLATDYKVVANIPYYLTSNLIRVLSEIENRPKFITLLIQKEVAERLCAGPGNMSLLSVWAQMYFTCTLGPLVPAQLFTPPPKVDSQIVSMKRLDQPVYGSADKKMLAQIIKAGFSNKRKTLHNSLSAGMQYDKQKTKDILEATNINILARPQELAISQWLKLADIISNT